MLDEKDVPALVRGLRAGQRDAWTTLYDGYNVEVWRYVARSVGPKAAAVADIVQEVFVAAAKSAHQFDPARGRLWSWLSGIAHHHVVAHWREAARTIRQRQLAENRELEFGRLFDSAESLEAICQNREFVEIVRFVLSEMSAEYAALLSAKYVDEQSLEDLSYVYGDSVDAIKSKLARARREFRTKFELVTGEPNPLSET